MQTTNIEPSLNSIPETMLWTLYNRASEASNKSDLISDPKAVEIYHSLSYDFSQKFGKSDASHAVRSLFFDQNLNEFIKSNPHGTVVNLGEGLETQRFRIDNQQTLWLSIDVSEAIQIREQFIQPDDQHKHIALSALDRQWFDLVPKEQPIFITAQGLFMYFNEDEVKSLIQDIANTFKSGYLMFDTIPTWFSNKTCSGEGWKKTASYTVPPMPWGVNRNDIEELVEQWLPTIKEIETTTFPNFYTGIKKQLISLLLSIPKIKNLYPTIVKISL